MNKINWKLLSAILSIAVVIASGFLIGFNWESLVSLFDNTGLTVSFLLSVLMSFITIINNSVSIIIKVFVVKNEKRKLVYLQHKQNLELEIHKIVEKNNINDYQKVKLIKEKLCEKSIK